MTAKILLLEEAPLKDFKQDKGFKVFQVASCWEKRAFSSFEKLFPRALRFETFAKDFNGKILVRRFLPGVSNPVAQTLAQVLGLEDHLLRVDSWIVSNQDFPKELLEKLYFTWREPAIEEHKVLDLEELNKLYANNPRPKKRIDDSFDTGEALKWGLEFEADELKVLNDWEKKNRKFTRAEWELFAQTWSEHCKHKIFGAEIEAPEAIKEARVSGLFSTYIRKPALKIAEKNPDRYLSLFHDNSGAIGLSDVNGVATEFSVCAKMETHNSPSAISPYGGASTGLVGVHRDILGTGRGALPIANWNVLCFEEPDHQMPRPATALSPDIIRSGVLRGIEDGGNQSGIPTVQGSVVFSPQYAVKPLVYAGSLGLLPKSFVKKHPRPGQKLYCFGGAVGADGLRGAVMSSRDIRGEDFSGSMVQVANAFVQRRVTDFLIEARDLGLIDVVTDNGAGGLASSVGEMATLTGGATIDLTHLRLKFENLNAWERLLSESQERMTVGSEHPKELEALAEKWEIPFDRLGELNNSGYLKVLFQGKDLVNLPLELLHEACPKMKLKTAWSLKKEKQFIEQVESKFPKSTADLLLDFPKMLDSVHLCSRKEIVRRFDHEVQGRNRRLPFAGATQRSPQDGSAVEIYEVSKTGSANQANLVLAHGLAPWRKSISENVLFSFDEALRQVLLAGGKWGTLAALDNFCWPDPISHEQRLWWLVRANQLLSLLTDCYQIPFVSGKDSMKNNSKDFAIEPTLVVSLFGSGQSVLKNPVGFFAKANDVLFVLKPEGLSFRDSVWERTMKTLSHEARAPLFSSMDSQTEDSEALRCLQLLKMRYEKLSGWIENGKIRSAKDISEGGTLTSIFEMCLGRGLGCDLSYRSTDVLDLLGEGLGGFVLALDPHFAQKFEKDFPEARRVGVVIRYDAIHFADKKMFKLSDLSESYEKKGAKGFWE